MTKFKTFHIYNTVEGILILNTDSEKEYIDKVKLIAAENEDTVEIETTKQADAYVLGYCGNLDLQLLK